MPPPQAQPRPIYALVARAPMRDHVIVHRRGPRFYIPLTVPAPINISLVVKSAATW